MRCYVCGNELTAQDFCTACGAEVGDYKKIRYLSDRLYNEALDKARIRDLSGAVRCLKQSLKLYKGNINARNLLGLVYYETGEMVAALTEWVISSNLQEEKNIAQDLLRNVQSEPQRLDTQERTAKKYNLALAYARQEDYDLAVIQLKRILQLNPGFLRARELLALLYLRAGEPERAKLECDRCIRIDSGNTTAKRYLKEAQAALLPADGKRRRKSGDDPQRYQSGNELIIQPPKSRGGSQVMSVGTALLGVALGVAAAWFLVLPGRVSRVQQAARQEIAAIGEESDAKSAQINDLSRRLQAAQDQVSALELEAQASAGQAGLGTADLLMQAVSAYLAEDGGEDVVRDAVKEHLLQLDPKALGSGGEELAHAQQLYEAFRGVVGESYAKAFYEDGSAAYRRESYEEAMLPLQRACELDPEKADYFLMLGRACYRGGDLERARQILEETQERFPDTAQADEARDIIAEIDNTSA